MNEIRTPDNRLPNVNRLRMPEVFVPGSIILANIIFFISDLIRTNTGKVIVAGETVILLIILGLALRGIFLPARIFTPLLTLLGMTYFLISGSGIHRPIIIGFPAVIVLAGLLLGQDGVAIFSILTTIVIASVGYAELNSFIVEASTLDIIDVNVFWILNLISGLVIFVTIKLLTERTAEAKAIIDAQTEENNKLRISQVDLEKHVEECEIALEYQTSQLATVAQIIHEAFVLQNASNLLSKIVHLIAEKFEYYHVGIFLLDDKERNAILQASSSEGGQRMLTRGYQLRVRSENIVGATVTEKRPHIALDTGIDAVFFNNPDLSETRSEIALPLLIRNKVLGVLDIQSSSQKAFIQQDIEIFQILANQLALIIQNARLVEEVHENIAQTESYKTEQNQKIWETHLESQSQGFIYTPLNIKYLETSEDISLNDNGEYVKVPIELRGMKIGKIILKRVSRPWSNKEKELVSDIANQVGLAIENARLVDETREQAIRNQLVSGFSSSLRKTLDMDTILKTALVEIRKTFKLQDVEVRLNIPEEEIKD